MRISSLPRAVPDGRALFPYVRDDSDARKRAPYAATLAQLQAAISASSGGAVVDPAAVVALGAEGTVWNARQSAEGWYTYSSDQRPGAGYGFVCRPDLPASGQMLDASPYLDVHIGGGQSWRVDVGVTADDLARMPYAGTADRWGCLQVTKAGGLYFAGGETAALVVEDVRGREFPTPDNGYDQITMVATQVIQRLRARDRRSNTPAAHFTCGYGGAPWWQVTEGGVFIAPGSPTWDALLKVVAGLPGIAAKYGKTLRWRSLGFTHGPQTDGRATTDYYDVLADVLASYDGLQLNGPDGEALRYYTDQANTTNTQTSVVRSDIAWKSQWKRQLDFALDHADRVHLIGPRYPYPLKDTIHHTGYGYHKVAELEGYVKYRTLDLGQPWVPLYITGASIDGRVITLQTSQPFAGGALAIDTGFIEPAQSYGFRVKIGGAFQTIESVAVAGTAITVTLASAPASGAVLELTYCGYGPGAPEGTHSGVWGNIKMAGPPSVLWPGDTIDTWLCYDYRELAV